MQLCTSFHSHLWILWIQNGVTVRKRSIWVKIGDFFVPCDLEIWRMTLKNNRAPLLCYLNLCASFTVRKRSIWVKIGDFFVPCDLEIWRMTLKNNRAPLLCYLNLCASFHSHLWNWNEVTVRKHQIWVKISNFFVPHDLEILQMTFKNNRVPLICYFKLCASLHSHLWIQNGVTVRKRSIWVKIGDFLSCVTLKFDGWPWKTIGHLLYAISSFVHHFIAICEFKMELQSGKGKFGSKAAIFVPCDLEIWQITLKNFRAPLLWYFKLCASFHSHLWIQTGVTVRKRLR